MATTVNGDTMCVRGKEAFADLHQTLTMLVEDRDDTALGGNIKPTEHLIKGKHVRVCANGMNGRHSLRVQIKDRQLRILLTGNKCQTMFAVEVESVASAATGQGIASDDLVFGRIDLGQLILPMHCDNATFRD